MEHRFGGLEVWGFVGLGFRGLGIGQEMGGCHQPVQSGYKRYWGWQVCGGTWQVYLQPPKSCMATLNPSYFSKKSPLVGRPSSELNGV